MAIKKSAITLGVVAVIALGALFALNFFTDSKSSTTVEPKVCFAGDCFLVEVADNPIEQARGLMNRQSLGQDHGMLFVFDREEIHSFWMKNTLIPLDVIWIGKDKRVKAIQTLEPCQTEECPHANPGSPALYVLEINGGLAQRSGINAGDAVDILY